MRAHILILSFMLLSTCFIVQADEVYYAPSLEMYCQIEHDGVTVIPNGRLLTPRGKQVLVEPHPYGLTISPDGKTIITTNNGTEPFSLAFIRDLQADAPSVHTVPESVKTDAGVIDACFMGLAVAPAPNDHLLYAAGGEDGTVMVWNMNTSKREATIKLNTEFRGRKWEDGYIGDLVLSPDGKRLYAVDQMNFRVVAIDTERNEISDVIPVGRYPFGLCITPDGSMLYAANIGMFEYSAIEGFDPDDYEETGLTFPAFEYLSDEMIEGGTAEGKYVPGLGEPNVPESVSVYAIDLSHRDEGKVAARIKTGVLVGQKVEDFPALAGSAPNSMVFDGRYVYVSNGKNDSISVIDSQSNKVVDTIKIRLPEPFDRLRGVIPFGLALLPDGSRLFVAESGINAVGVIDTKSREVLGHIPVGWFPSKLKVSPDGKTLYVANAKGFGAGPNGGPGVDLGGRSGIGNLMRGTVSIFDIPSDEDLAIDTQQVLNNNYRKADSRPWQKYERNPIPPFPGAYKSPIKYTVFIIKENRTYDQVFGELEGGCGEPSLADYGMNATICDRQGENCIENINVMPNHQILSRRYAASDNFYCDSDHSADGHRWLQGVYPGVWTETATTASYGGRRHNKIASTAPGRRAVTGAYAALIPEDYNESGSIWDHWFRNDVSFFNFGMGFEFPGSSYGDGNSSKEWRLTGMRIALNYPLPAPLMDRTSRKYATFNTNIPDQFRTDMFLEELEDRWLSGKEPFPQVITMSLPNDHGATPRPGEGYPYFASFMGDNDLALGRIVEKLSHTPYWNEMAIFITEDDAQNGRDHIDHHRSVCMVVSPYAKKGYVSHVHTSIPSILKTIHLIHGIPPVNQYDAMASDLSDMFQSQPDFRPYDAVPVHPKLFDPSKALDPFDADFNWESLNDFPIMDSPEVMRKWMQEDAERRMRKEQR